MTRENAIDQGMDTTAWSDGSEQGAEELLPGAYDELRRMARLYLSQERRGHTLQPTALVNEALVRLLGGDVHPSNRTHFFALTARTMRRVLVDHARIQRADKRIQPEDRVTLTPESIPHDGASSALEVDVLDLNDALERFSKISPRSARLVELRYFAGLSNPESAQVLGVSVATVERDWKMARIWLRHELKS